MSISLQFCDRCVTNIVRLDYEFNRRRGGYWDCTNPDIFHWLSRPHLVHVFAFHFSCRRDSLCAELSPVGDNC